jgi:hypothetical protein
MEDDDLWMGRDGLARLPVRPARESGGAAGKEADPTPPHIARPRRWLEVRDRFGSVLLAGDGLDSITREIGRYLDRGPAMIVAADGSLVATVTVGEEGDVLLRIYPGKPWGGP